jgi:ATP/maltotriose-dependent transcriptional regulator MalT
VDYDADRAPEPAAWLAADEGERLAAVEAHHRTLTSHAAQPKPRLHAAIHLVVEGQLATGDPPEARRALERLVAGGLPRHEAVHAIGLLVADAVGSALNGRRFDAAGYARELDLMTVERWRKLAEGE